MSETPAPRKRRRTLLRVLLWSAVSILALVTGAAGILFFWTTSPSFESWIRKRMVERLEQSTGGRVEVGSFHWRPFEIEGELGGVVIHGLEGPGEAPYASVDMVRARVSVLDLWSPKILLRDLKVVRPSFHFIVYPDGSTNQPTPRAAASSGGKSTLDTVFDLEAGHIAVEQGVLDYEDRAAEWDFQERKTLLDFSAKDVSLRMSYVWAARGKPESYHIEAGARDLAALRGAPPFKTQQAHGYLQATADLMRNAVYLRSLRITTPGRADADHGKEHTLELSGSLQDFNHPRWQGHVVGDLDLRVIDPVIGFPRTPEGIARFDLAAAGSGGEFRVDGGMHVENGSYIGNGVTAVGFNFDGHLHADPRQLLFTSSVLRFKQGGRMEGTVALSPWLDTAPVTASLEPQGPRNTAAARGAPPAKKPEPEDDGVPMNGKVTSVMKDVPLDTILDVVGRDELERVGFDTILNGPATGTWLNGDDSTIEIGVTLSLTPGNHPEPGEVPASGTFDATYANKVHSIDLRRLDLITPGGELDARGAMGVHPVSGPSSMTVDFHSHDIRDYDIFLRNIGLERGGITGVAALPATLAGQAEYHGAWTGSLIDPHLTGTAHATNLSIETLPQPGEKTGRMQWVHWDAIEAAGSYSAERIDISRGVLHRGNTEIDLAGSLIAASPPLSLGKAAPSPSFDDDSTLHLRLHAANVDAHQLLPLTGSDLPLAGAIDTQLVLDGPIRSLTGSGSAELNGGSIYGEPVTRVRAQGDLASQVVRVSSLSIESPAGAIQAKGEVNLKTTRFKLDSSGSGVDVSRVDWLHRSGVRAMGSLAFTLSGSGTFDDPRLEAGGTFRDLAVNGEPLGPLEMTARMADHAVTYKASTRVEAASVALTGQTKLSGAYLTTDRLEFSQFNVGAVLAMAHLQSLNGESALAGVLTLDGPLAHIEQLRGDARLHDLALTVAGVHLKSDDGLHATLANARVMLDPLHVTGEQTDLRAQGSLGLKDAKQLDFAANGSINLKLGEMLDPDLTASGTTTFQVEGHGPIRNPGLRGRIDFQNGSLALGDVPNGLSQIHGALEFNQDRLEVKSLTAVSGGGQLSVAGYLAYQRGLYADLSVTGKGIRIRYPAGVSSLADGTFHLQGVEDSLLLSGNVLITRFSVSPDIDIGALTAQANAMQPIVSPDAPSNHIRLDVHITSSPQLNFQNTVAKLAGNVDLRLRGTVASPTLLGGVQITEGSALIAGTRYELERGSISFTNPVRIEPSIDLSASAHVSDYDITLGLHGTPTKMSVSYRSDPPLPEADVVALLALGRTGNQQRLYTQQQEQEGSSPATDALLGGALNATVSSRVQKLFGAGSVKVDPNYLGALGNSTSRIIVEEQVGKYMTLTYATNVNTTQQQLLQAEIAINRHVSLLVARDESGVFSMVVKATRRFR